MSLVSRTTVPLHFGSADAPLFGWYHPPRVPARRCGVVLCNPIGDDYVRAHRALRHLAERLQRCGFPVLRFDFHGTGDSAGDERDPARVRTWVGDIGRAIDELRALSGAGEICLAGLRLGATLAMVAAAERGGVDSLVLWSPYGDGRAYVDETTRLHKMHKMLEPHSFALEPTDWQPGGAEALGFLLTPDTIADLGQIDLLKVGRPAQRALVVGSGNLAGSAGDDPLMAHLGRLGVETDARHLPGQKFLISVPHQATLPDAILDVIVDWISGRHLEVVPAAVRVASVRSEPTTFPEEPLTFGEGRGLFGILTRPPTVSIDAAAARPAIVLLSAGTVHRIGPHRLYVTLARRWARLGFHVFRVDLSGIGDSRAADGCEENLCYPKSGVADVQEAMAALETVVGVRRFVLAGLCSGGDLTFQTALRDPRVVGAVIINPRTFCVNDLELVETYKRARNQVEALGQPGQLARILRGEVDVEHLVGTLLANVRSIWERRRIAPPSGGLRADVPGCLRLLAEGGVDTLLVASGRDPGVEYVDRHFARGMRALGGLRNFRRADFPGTDHTFTSLFAQELVSNTISDHFAHRYLS
jgi:alpha-beta hydrolase superfamily lysophospholipase